MVLIAEIFNHLDMGCRLIVALGCMHLTLEKYMPPHLYLIYVPLIYHFRDPTDQLLLNIYHVSLGAVWYVVG